MLLFFLFPPPSRCFIFSFPVFFFACSQVNGKTLKFKAAVIATGGSAALPPIPGLKEAPYLTNASVFNLTALPRRLVSPSVPARLFLLATLLREGRPALEENTYIFCYLFFSPVMLTSYYFVVRSIPQEKRPRKHVDMDLVLTASLSPRYVLTFRGSCGEGRYGMALGKRSLMVDHDEEASANS